MFDNQPKAPLDSIAMPHLDSPRPHNVHADYVSKSQREDNASASLWAYNRLLHKAGKWRETLGLAPSKKLILEVGCHYGYTLSEFARLYPEYFCIGIDITFKRIVKTHNRMKSEQENPFAVMLCKSQSLNQIFEKEELDGLVIWFPDPWPKKKHAKHRMISDKNLTSYLTLIRDGGFFWFKSDSKDYADIVDNFIQRRPDLRKTESPPFALGPSRFEKSFRQKGAPIYESFFTKTVL